MGQLEFTSTFTYQPLELPTSIRIVVLRQGSGANPIICDLLHTELSTQPYEALSYEWGMPDDRDPKILVDGCLVPIRSNLHEALLHIRKEDEDRHLWIDALCINQGDGEERNQQVQMMGKIFSGAEQVIVWLGLAADGSDIAMDILTEIHEYKAAKATFADQKLDESWYQSLSDEARKEWSTGCIVSVKRLQNLQFDEVAAICNRSYWSRMWMMQEVHLARSLMLHCGSKSVPGMALSLFLSLFPVMNISKWSGYGDSIGSSAAERHFCHREMKAEGVPLEDWLNMCIGWDFASTEPRDYVYAVIGLASDCRDCGLLPDYQKPLVEVYWETIALCKMLDPGVVNTYIPERMAWNMGLLFEEDGTYIGNVKDLGFDEDGTYIGNFKDYDWPVED